MKTKDILAGFVLIVAISGRAATTNDLSATLRNGLFEEQVNHNLDAAIATYQIVVTQFDKDRQLAATAVFRLGECYRTLGKTNEAAAQYQRVLRDFADQRTLLELSRQSLTSLQPQQAQTLPLISLEQLRSFVERARVRVAAIDALPETNHLAGLVSIFANDEIIESQIKQRELLDKQLQILRAKYPEDNAEVRTAKQLAQSNEEVLEARVSKLEADARHTLSVTEKTLKDRQATEEGTGQSKLTEGAISTTDEEDQEIRRIQSMIQNSPDLINATAGKDSRTPLERAAYNDWLQVAQFLLEHGANPNWGDPLYSAAVAGHKKLVELLLENGAEVDATGINNQTPLNKAAERRFQAVVEVLLAHKANLNISGNDDVSPLHHAVQNSSKAIAEMLLAHGADVNAKNGSGETPLHLAAQKGYVEIASLLLTNKADVNAQTTLGNTPLHYGASNSDIIKLLLAHGAEVNARGQSGEVPLARASNANAANALLEAKADPNLPSRSGDHEGWTPLHYAAYNGDTAVAEALLEHGANPNIKLPSRGKLANTFGSTPLRLAIERNNLEMVTLLLRYKADPNLAGDNNQSPLELAISQKNVDITQALLAHGAELKARNGVTPLLWAVDSGSKTLVETVLAHNPDVNAIYSALDFTHGKPELAEIAELLRAHGALDNVPRYDRIQISRPSANLLETVFLKGTNDWNRFTLMEAILNFYPLPSDPLGIGGHVQDAPFPDLTHLSVIRKTRGGTNETRIPVNLLNTTNGVDCSKDLMLEFGDVVEIPEREHALSENPIGLTQSQRDAMEKCRRGSVNLVVNGKPIPLLVSPYPQSAIIRMLLFSKEAQKALLSSSDIAHVKVIRRDPQTGKKREWILDCSNQQSSPDFWLRDGDVIDVPEK